jgi:carbon monoxide dehydrogenase subunit G
MLHFAFRTTQMQITGSYQFAAPAARVWTLLMDTAAIAACVPGCQELTPVGENRFRAKLAVVVAAITGSYDATIELAVQLPPHGYTLHVDGQGRGGFIKGTSKIALVEQGMTTRVEVNADVQVGGPVARVGQRLLEGVGRAMMDRFFACLGSRL